MTFDSMGTGASTLVVRELLDGNIKPAKRLVHSGPTGHLGFSTPRGSAILSADVGIALPRVRVVDMH